MLTEGHYQQNKIWFCLYVEDKKQNTWTNVAKKTHRHREQSGGCQKGGWDDDRNGHRRLNVQTSRYKVYK